VLAGSCDADVLRAVGSGFCSLCHEMLEKLSWSMTAMVSADEEGGPSEGPRVVADSVVFVVFWSSGRYVCVASNSSWCSGYRWLLELRRVTKAVVEGSSEVSVGAWRLT